MVKLASAHTGEVISHIRNELIAQDMLRFEQELEHALAPQKGYLSDTEMGLYRLGKKLRPIVLLLSARLFRAEGDLPRKVVMASASLEMLHVATLIHDDIVDHAAIRRGINSVNAARGTEMAVLIGDMQFLQAVRCFVNAVEDDEDMQLVKWVLDTAFEICRGQIDEMNTKTSWATDVLHARYLSTIDRKTAVLFGLACEAGAALMKARTSDLRRLGTFGRHLGRAFQMMDDIFDLAHSDKEAGKCKGLDLHRRRLTLPIIHAMRLFGETHPMVQYLRGKEANKSQINLWVDEIRQSKAFGLAYEEARRTALFTVRFLEPFEPSPYRQALHDLAMYVVNRGY